MLRPLGVNLLLYRDMKLTKTLFLVDDDVDEHELFEEALQNADLDVQLITAKNGIEALEKLDDGAIIKPDLIFLDLNMPKMNGLQFLERIKGSQYHSGIPVFIYTTSSANDDRQKALHLGATSFFTKPNNIDDLSQTIRSAVARV